MDKPHLTCPSLVLSSPVRIAMLHRSISFMNFRPGWSTLQASQQRSIPSPRLTSSIFLASLDSDPIVFSISERDRRDVNPGADLKFCYGLGSGWRRAIASSAFMSCITACRPSRIEPNPGRRNRFMAAVRSVAMTQAPLPRYRCASSRNWVRADSKCVIGILAGAVSMG